MTEVSNYDGITQEDVEYIQAILKAFYDERLSRKATMTSICDETIRLVSALLEETGECSHWIDAVPSPKDLLSPTSSFKKYALRLIRDAGKAFMDTSLKVNIMCKVAVARNFRTPIEMSLR